MAGVGVVAAESEEEAKQHLEVTRRSRAKNIFSRGDRRLTDDEVTAILASPQAAAVDEMLTYTAVGTADAVAGYLDRFQEQTGVDELITVHYAPTVAGRIRSVEITAGAVELAGRRTA
jgi:alkanesulfonate monooxygenase SsuD/methylene tetrahydromethanopterin reductase-like flavin-dependent oxidoreductase (luciferase family)